MSKIEWTDRTWNPVTGCDRVSPGCAHCYAMELAPRLRRFAQARERAGKPGGKWLDVRDGGKASGPAFGVTLHEDALDAPLRWRRPRRVFVNSMSDLFHDEIPDDFIARVFGVMASAPQHTFQVLTKRPERMQALLSDDRFVLAASQAVTKDTLLPIEWPLANVWLGVSVENRRFVGRADVLRATPAALRFISAEPLLGPLLPHHTTWFDPHPYEEQTGDPADQVAQHVWEDDPDYEEPGLDLTGIDQLIVGGESGPKHRPIKADWVRDLRDEVLVQDRYAAPQHDPAPLRERTAFFFKQWGGARPGSGGRELDGRTWDEQPARGHDTAEATR